VAETGRDSWPRARASRATSHGNRRCRRRPCPRHATPAPTPRQDQTPPQPPPRSTRTSPRRGTAARRPYRDQATARSEGRRSTA
jgi:hypothetical protein